MLQVTLYTKDGCTSCDMLKLQLRMFQRLYPHELIEVDIEADPALLARYRFQIPVLAIGDDVVLKAPIHNPELVAALRRSAEE